MIWDLRRIAGVFLLLCGLLSLGACSQQAQESLLYRAVPREKVDLTKRYVAVLADGKIGFVENDLDPGYFDGNAEATLNQIASLFPKERPRSVRFIGANVMSNTGGPTLYGVVLEYEYSHIWIVANIVLETKAGSNKIWIAGMHVTPLSQSLEETNAFRLEGKSAIHYIALALAIFMPLFTLITAVVAARSYVPRWKWLWVIFILLGFGQFNLNWTTGQTGLVILAFQLLGASYMQPMFGGPVILSFGIPVGAILFWMRRDQWPKKKAENATADLRS